MAKNREKLANLLGAKIVGEVPDVGGGAFGMARLAHFLHQRLTPSQGERPGRPTDANWVHRPKVPMSEDTYRTLVEIAEAMSTPERKISPMQAAAHLLEEAVSQVSGTAEHHVEEIEENPADFVSSKRRGATRN
ncbi:MAG TPA: hypothetical protein VH643_41575 [Gemmataceae bacterium]|jgi:hypothetical protein